MKFQRPFVIGMTVLAICACATTPEREPASQESSGGTLTKICKTPPGAKFELYNKSGLFRDEPDEIHFFGPNGAGPHIFKKGDKNFKTQYSTLEGMIILNGVECSGVEKIEETVISDLKANLDNFGQSSCTDSNYLKAIDSTIKSLRSPSENTTSQLNQFDILFETMKDIKDTSLRTSREVCNQRVAKTLKKLNSLPLVEEKVKNKKDENSKGTN